ncbi:hypothetical protein XJ44_01960 [Thermosipho affectus]|uniref:Extracellular solute-binding protein family 1 n=1 Tax=Thermosipho affectus TaxID=660294 RepID=A0ABX3IKQ1_9BACT|nr:hypothetical protein [Thermosipho affectus]ONN27759.1 hypothetical protein XJ44_01960 [Thermosipho affectus]
MKKLFGVIFLFFSILYFSTDLPEYHVIELIKPFKEIRKITIYTEKNIYNVDLYDTVLKDSNSYYFKGEKIKEIKVDGKYLKEKNWEIWLSWEGTDDIKTFIENYTKLNDVKIKVLSIPKISSKIIPQSKSNIKLPDVIMASAFDYPTYKKLNIIKGNAYNFYFDTQVVYVNKKFEGMIKNWDIKEIEKILKTTGKKIAINPISAYWFSTFLMGYGKIPLIGEKFVLNDEITKKAILKIKSWYKNGYFDFLNKQAQIASFNNEESIFMFQGTFLYPTLKKLMPNKFIVKPLPKPLIPFKDYKVFVTTKDGNEDFTKWLTLLLKSPRFKKFFSEKYYKFFDETMPGKPIPFDLRYVNFHKNVSDILKLILLDKIEINKALDNLERIVNE